MKRSTVTLVTFALAAGAMAAYSRVDSVLIQGLRATRSEVRWDARSEQTTADLDGDWMPDLSAVGYVPDGVVLAIRSTLTGKVHFVDFRVAKDDPAAFCAAPVKLSRAPLSCAANPAGMPGCREATRTAILVLNDGSCPPMNVYWDHDNRGPVWWRTAAKSP